MQALIVRCQPFRGLILSIRIADRHFSSEQGHSETGSLVELPVQIAKFSLLFKIVKNGGTGNTQDLADSPNTMFLLPESSHLTY